MKRTPKNLKKVKVRQTRITQASANNIHPKGQVLLLTKIKKP